MANVEVLIHDVPVEQFSKHIRLLLQSRSPLLTSDTKSCTVCTTTADSEFVWYVQDDNGRYTEVEQSVNEKLNSSLQDQKDNFLHNGCLYKVDFAHMNLHETRTNVNRPLRKENPKWLFQLTGTTVYLCHPNDVSDSIEKMYHFGGTDIKIAGARQTIDFANSSQISLPLGEYVQTLKRFPQPLKNIQPVREVLIKITGLRDNIIKADRQLNETLNSQLHFVAIPCPMLQIQCKRPQISNFLRQYCIEFSELQTFPIPHVKLEGTSGYVTTIQRLFEQYLHQLSSQAALFTTGTILRELFRLPQNPVVAPPESQVLSQSHAISLPAQSNCTFQSIQEDSDEWRDILERMRTTKPRVKITQIERICNIALQKIYQAGKSQMRIRNNGDINEKILFHGTKEVDPKIIAKTGVDYNSTKHNFWGRGAYFAVNASFCCSRFAYDAFDGGHKQVLLASVLTGRSYSYGNTPNRDLVQPPDGYDSINGHLYESLVYVMYDNKFTRLDYIITYHV